MTSYYKLPEQNIYWKIIDETTTVFQVRNTDESKNASKTTGVDRYNGLMQVVSNFTASNETEFNTALSAVLADMN